MKHLKTFNEKENNNIELHVGDKLEIVKDVEKVKRFFAGIFGDRGGFIHDPSLRFLKKGDTFRIENIEKNKISLLNLNRTDEFRYLNDVAPPVGSEEFDPPKVLIRNKNKLIKLINNGYIKIINKRKIITAF